MTLAALAAAACIAGSVAATPRAEAADRVDVGVLVCHVKASIGWIITSKQEMTCTFSSSQGDLPQRYAGSITTVGLDLGVTGAGIMTWGVLAVTSQVAPGALAGTYVGATGDIALGVGVCRQCADRRRQVVRAQPVLGRGQCRRLAGAGRRRPHPALRALIAASVLSADVP